MNTETIKRLMETDPAAAAAEIKEYITRKNNASLNIAITGESGSGKSTFINHFRGMADDDEGAAPTGVTETTLGVNSYPHPKYPNVILWDLPGVGTPKFPADEYLKKVGFEKFDFFIIISVTRFRENDVKLAKEIKKMGKKFYFVRSKIDSDLQAEKRKKNFNEEETKEKMRNNSIQGLQDEGFESPQVFLLNSFDLHLHDFPLLHETLDKELPEQKRHALLMAMPTINLEVINKKKKAFQAQIKYYATASAFVPTVPVSGLNFIVDMTLIVTAVQNYVVSFRLDVSSLERLANTTGVPFTDLINVIKSPLAAKKITPAVIRKCLTELGSVIEAEQGWSSWLGVIPLVGAPINYTRTCIALNHFINTLSEDAERVFKKALGLNSSV